MWTGRQVEAYLCDSSVGANPVQTCVQRDVCVHLATLSACHATSHNRTTVNWNIAGASLKTSTILFMVQWKKYELLSLFSTWFLEFSNDYTDICGKPMPPWAPFMEGAFVQWVARSRNNHISPFLQIDLSNLLRTTLSRGYGTSGSITVRRESNQKNQESSKFNNGMEYTCRSRGILDGAYMLFGGGMDEWNAY